MMEERLALRIAECRTMRQAFELIRAHPMIGDFLAYQYVTDLNYSTICNFTEMEFVIPGPGPGTASGNASPAWGASMKQASSAAWPNTRARNLPASGSNSARSGGDRSS